MLGDTKVKTRDADEKTAAPANSKGEGGGYKGEGGGGYTGEGGQGAPGEEGAAPKKGGFDPAKKKKKAPPTELPPG